MPAIFKKMELITYDCGYKFVPELFNKITNFKDKPRGGLWASPIDSNYGWKEACYERDIDINPNESFEFTCEGLFLVIDGVEDLKSMLKTVVETVKCGDDEYNFYGWDFERLVDFGISAIHLTKNGLNETAHSDPGLFGWDCECVLVLNPKTVKMKEVV